MPIRPFLHGEQFDQETIRILGVAFEQVCVALRTGDCDDYVKQAIANKIIELAKAGERNPDLLCERALKGIREPQCRPHLLAAEVAARPRPLDVVHAAPIPIRAESTATRCGEMVE